MFLVLNYTSFWFELIIQEIFEMEIKKMVDFTFHIIFHLKMIFCQKFNLFHTYHQCPKKLICNIIIFKLFTLFVKIQSYIITMFSKHYKFHKDLESFNTFKSTFTCFNTLLHAIFLQ